MSDSPVSLYDPARFEQWISADRLGGINRAKSARRDRYGRFQPDNSDLPEPQEPHGRAGGIARAERAKRINGRYVKEN